jgi:hypothetical protein
LLNTWMRVDLICTIQTIAPSIEGLLRRDDVVVRNAWSVTAAGLVRYQDIYRKDHQNERLWFA